MGLFSKIQERALMKILIALIYLGLRKCKDYDKSYLNIFYRPLRSRLCFNQDGKMVVESILQKDNKSGCDTEFFFSKNSNSYRIKTNYGYVCHDRRRIYSCKAKEGDSGDFFILNQGNCKRITTGEFCLNVNDENFVSLYPCDYKKSECFDLIFSDKQNNTDNRNEKYVESSNSHEKSEFSNKQIDKTFDSDSDEGLSSNENAYKLNQASLLISVKSDGTKSKKFTKKPTSRSSKTKLTNKEHDMARVNEKLDESHHFIAEKSPSNFSSEKFYVPTCFNGYLNMRDFLEDPLPNLRQMKKKYCLSISSVN